MSKPFIEKNFAELLKLNYEEVCNYYKQKYGHPLKDYFVNENCRSTNAKVNSRTKEGLMIHHIDEDKAIMLSTKAYAQNNPFAYQKKERLVYCNYLEHLLLHIKIVEYPHLGKNKQEAVGTGGIYNFLVPELNDIFSGIKYKVAWKENVAEVVISQKANYYLLLSYLIRQLKYDKPLLTSFNMKYHNHSFSKNFLIYEEIINLGLNLQNEITVWEDFFACNVQYLEKDETACKTPPLKETNWLWDTFQQQIKQTTNKKDVFLSFLWSLVILCHIIQNYSFYIAFIMGLFLKPHVMDNDSKIDAIDELSLKMYTELNLPLKPQQKLKAAFKKAKQNFKQDMLKTAKQSKIEIAMSFFTSLVPIWVSEYDNIEAYWATQ